MTRLSDDRLAELYAGTLALVAERGFDRVSMDAIAEATHSSKATLYRQWGSKTALVAQALLFTVDRSTDDDIDTGSLRGDLVEMLCHEKDDPIEDGALIGALMDAIRQDAELERALREQVIEVGKQRIAEVLQKSVDRGDVAPDHPGLDQIPLLVIAQFVLQPLIYGAVPDDAAKTHYVDTVLLPVLGH